MRRGGIAAALAAALLLGGCVQHPAEIAFKSVLIFSDIMDGDGKTETAPNPAKDEAP